MYMYDAYTRACYMMPTLQYLADLGLREEKIKWVCYNLKIVQSTCICIPLGYLVHSLCYGKRLAGAVSDSKL